MQLLLWASLRAFARSATLSSMPMSQTAVITNCSKRKQFNRPRSISLFSHFFERLPSPDTNAVTYSFHGIELGLCLLLLFPLRSDRLAPYRFFWLVPYCFYTRGLCSLLISGLGLFSCMRAWLLPVFGVCLACLPPLLLPGDMNSHPVSFPVRLRWQLPPAIHFRLCWFWLPIFLLVDLFALRLGRMSPR